MPIDETHRRLDDEHALLGDFLDYVRETVLSKVDGVSDDDARRPRVPSGTSLGGLVKHLTDVERGWFVKHFAGREVVQHHTDEDPEADMRMEPGETLAELVADYRRACDEARAVYAAASLDDEAAEVHPRRGRLTLRWIGWHMVEETARHNGHLDILREQLDGMVEEY